MSIHQKLVNVTVLSLFILVVFEPSLFARSDASKLLDSRSLTEEQYLKKIPPVVRDLYGPMAVPALKLLWKNIGPVFAMDALTRAYGEIWALKGPLNVNERSVATVSALVAQKLYPQIKIHINGYISSGGTLEGLYELVGTAVSQIDTKLPDSLVDAVYSGLVWREQSIDGFKSPTKEEIRVMLKKGMKHRDGEIFLDARTSLLVKLSSQVALGNMEKVREYMNELVKKLPSNINKDSYVDLLLTHLIVYCGYPKGMNAFAVWQQLRGEFGMK